MFVKARASSEDRAKDHIMNPYENLRRHILKNSGCDPSGRTIEYHLSHLAAQFGVTVRDVSETLSEMQAEGLIEFKPSGAAYSVRVTAKGAETFSNLPTNRIGY